MTHRLAESLEMEISRNPRALRTDTVLKLSRAIAPPNV